MASRGLGELTLSLVVRTGAFTAGMTAAERQANKSLTAIEKRAYKFGQNLGTAIRGGAVIATAALTAVSVAVGQAIDRADEMRDLSIRTGIATEKLSEYAYAAKQTGTDIDGLARGLKLIAKNAAEAADAGSGKGKLFEALGVNVKDAQGNLKQLDQLLPEVADKFQSLEDGTTKAALAQELFGKSGAELIEFLNQGSAGIEEAGKKVDEFNSRIGTDFSAQADEFNDKLGDLKEIANGFANQIAAQLLPRMIELIDKLNATAKEGQLLGTKVTDVTTIFDLFAGQMAKADEVGESFRKTAGGVATYVTLLKGAFSDLLSLNVSGFFSNAVAAAKQAKQNLLTGFNLEADFSDVVATVQGRRAGNARGGSNRKETGGRATDLALQASINAVFADTSGGKNKSSGGKSDAENEADKLKAAYDRMNESLTEQIALFGATGEAAKVRYDLENGELSKLTEAEKESLIVKAEQLDQLNLMKELQDAAAKASEEESERIRDGIKATDEVISNLEFELELLGKSNIERAKAIELRNLDANATDEQRDAVARLTEELIRASENQQFLDDFKEGLADAFVDFVSGAKSAKDAFGDFADELFKRALQFVADKAIQAMFDAFSGGGTGSGTSGGTGGGWQQWLGTIMGAFGGGRAGGGSVLPGKFYRVNESGMEMATVDGRDYLMTGSKSGMITPASQLGASGVNQYNSFYIDGRTDQRTQQQVASRIAYETSQVTRRNK